MSEPTIEEVREYVGLQLAFYQTDAMINAPTEFRVRRRENQIVAVVEILRLLDGNRSSFNALRERGLVPLTLDDLPRRLGGFSDE
jgi:hypothetical protein